MDRSAITRVAAAIELLIDVLDSHDGDPDHEDAGDYEPEPLEIDAPIEWDRAAVKRLRRLA